MTNERAGALASAISRWGQAAVIRCTALTRDQLLAKAKRRRDFRATVKEQREAKRREAMAARLAKQPASSDGDGAS
jgi:hypothetical protein